jgi:DNA-binding NtrC family response regulator
MAETMTVYPMSRAAVSFTSLRQLLEDYERRLILEALGRARGNQRRAAAELGCLPTTLNEKMRRLGLRARDQARRQESEPAGANAGLELVGIA